MSRSQYSRKSASVSNSDVPYTKYAMEHGMKWPDLCTNWTCRHFLKSKLMALNALVLVFATVIIILALFLPFWFTWTYTKVGLGITVEYRMDLGIGYMLTAAGQYSSILTREKSGNPPFINDLFRVGQIFFFLGSFGTILAMFTMMILACRKFASIVAELGLAVFLFATTGSLAIGIVFVLIGRDTTELGVTFHVIPGPLSINWGCYLAILGAGVMIFCTVVHWIQAIKTCRRVEAVRKKQLSEPRRPPQEQQRPLQMGRQPQRGRQPPRGRTNEVSF